MFKTTLLPAKGTATRSHILSTALQVFRAKGLDATTMRELAAAAGTSLGSAYYYFPSKEAIIQAYYDDVQAEHARRLTAALDGKKLDLLERLRAAFHAKLDILQSDRKLIGTLFRFAGEPDHPLSVFGAATKATRQQSVAIFEQAIGDESMPEEIRQILPSALWALHMGVLLYFIYDDSSQQGRTHRLVDGGLTLLTRLLALAKLPFLKPIRGGVIEILRDAGLAPSSGSVQGPKENTPRQESIEKKKRAL